MTEMHEPGEHVPIENLVEAAMVYCHILGTQLGYEDGGEDGASAAGG